MTIEKWLNGIEYSMDAQSIINKRNGYQLIADIRGWGRLQYLFPTHAEAEHFQDSVGEFITQAIKEKLERENKLT